VEVEEKEAKGDDNDDGADNNDDNNGDNNNNDDDDDDGNDGNDDDDDDGDDNNNNNNNDNDDNDNDDNDNDDNNNNNVEEEAEEAEEAAVAESNDVQMLVDEELEVSAFTLVSSEKHLTLERILRTTGSQRLPRELLPLQESGRACPWGWVGPPRSAMHCRGSALPVLFTLTP